eukprot:TRINITY_DN74281_c0_g1_i1.p1 TRINITY_DN74281_c0_g1~~TRINITY_DN74281_c0_g1_i1.p1  ORF type:complete len:268 (+),score=42.34 TRINITY_DN74281_c0_g1_i1:105-806(+)
MWEYLGAWARKTAAAVARAAATVPWAARVPVAFFRGAESGCRRPRAALARGRRRGACDAWDRVTWSLWPRSRLAILSRKRPDLVDAKIVSRFAHHPQLRTAFTKRNLTGPAVRAEDQLQYRYLVDLDGTTQSNRFVWALMSGSLVIKQTSYAAIWCSGILKPWRHYVPVKGDLADLPGVLNWARTRDAEAERLAARGMAVARRHLGLEASLRYLHHLIVTLAAARVNGTNSAS